MRRILQSPRRFGFLLLGVLFLVGGLLSGLPLAGQDPSPADIRR